jgi:hypothetical protein
MYTCIILVMYTAENLKRWCNVNTANKIFRISLQTNFQNISPARLSLHARFAVLQLPPSTVVGGCPGVRVTVW